MTPEDKAILEEFRKPKKRDRYFKIRNILNLVYILLVFLTIAIYFIYPLPDGLPIFFTTCMIAILVKAVEVYLRIIAKKSTNKND